jgi:hypothetical protein
MYPVGENEESSEEARSDDNLGFVTSTAHSFPTMHTRNFWNIQYTFRVCRYLSKPRAQNESIHRQRRLQVCKHTHTMFSAILTEPNQTPNSPKTSNQPPDQLLYRYSTLQYHVNNILSDVLPCAPCRIMPRSSIYGGQCIFMIFSLPLIKIKTIATCYIWYGNSKQ